MTDEKLIRINKKELPESWNVAKIEDISTVILGQSPASSSYNTTGEGLPFFQGKTEFGAFYPQTVKWCTEPKKTALKNDILISVRAPVGPTNLSPAECCIGRGLAAIRSNDGISYKYLLYYLRSIESEVASLGTGTTFKAISGGILKNLTVSLAPEAQQKRIVAEIEKQFSRLDEAVDNLKRVKANLKRYKASVLKAAVEGKLTEEWRANNKDVEPADKLLERILAERRKKWEEAELAKMRAKGKEPKDDKWKKKYKEPAKPELDGLPALPNGWLWVRLESTSECLGGYAFKSKDFTEPGYQIVKMANIKMNKLDLSQQPSFIKDIPENIFNKYRLLNSDILVTLTGTRKKRDYGYIVKVKKQKETLLLNQRIARLRPYINGVSSYIAIAMQSEVFRNRFFSHETGNVGQGNVGMRAVTTEAIALPPLEEQKEIIIKLERSFSVADRVAAQVEACLKRSERVRQSILKKAFSGDLISQNYNDDPDSVFLKDIQDQNVPIAKSKQRKKSGNRRSR